MAQPQFVYPLFLGNPVIIAVTLNLNDLLFRYFQYAFHLDEFSIWRKSTEEIQAMLYVLGRTLSVELGLLVTVRMHTLVIFPYELPCHMLVRQLLHKVRKQFQERLHSLIGIC